MKITILFLAKLNFHCQVIVKSHGKIDRKRTIHIHHYSGYIPMKSLVLLLNAGFNPCKKQHKLFELVKIK